MYLIVGGDSTIGQALAEFWEEKGVYFHASTRRKELVSDSRPFIDLQEPQLSILDSNYDGAIICAAISRLADCESDPETSRKINVVGTYEIARQLINAGTFVLFLSSNQVFDGEKPFRKTTDERKPINEYGKQKAEAETLIEKLTDCCILRLTKVIYPTLPLLVEWREKLGKGLEINAFTDITLSPVNMSEVNITIAQILKEELKDIQHCSGHEDISYYEYALIFAEQNGYPKSLIGKDSYKNNNNITFIPPRYTSLN